MSQCFPKETLLSKIDTVYCALLSCPGSPCGDCLRALEAFTHESL